MLRAAIYTRISRDRSGDTLGTSRQEKDCRKLVKARGWSVATVFTDDDVSAYSGTRRDGYQSLLEAIRAGNVDAVVAWHPDRLHRSPRELEDFIDLVESSKCRVATVQTGEYDLATPAGRMTARVVGAVARGESEHKAARLRRKHAELAERGRWKGGRRPYGYTMVVGSGTLEVVEPEAAAIREAAARVLAGEPVGAVVNDFNRRGVPTANDAAWRTQTLKRVLTNPTVAGLREYHGDVVGDANWSAIIEPAERDRLVRVVLDPSRARTPPARVALLAGGLILCGRCGTAMVSARRARRESDVPARRIYVCRSNTGGCGSLTISAGSAELTTDVQPLGVENLVVEALLQRVDTPNLGRLISKRPTDTGVEKELVEVRERLDELAVMYAAGQITATQWMKAQHGLEERQTKAQGQLTTAMGSSALAPYGKAGSLRAAWPQLTTPQRGATVRAVLKAVTVAPATRLGRTFDPSRLSFEYLV